jgi:hypothetical protein
MQFWRITPGTTPQITDARHRRCTDEHPSRSIHKSFIFRTNQRDPSSVRTVSLATKTAIFLTVLDTNRADGRVATSTIKEFGTVDHDIERVSMRVELIF